MIQRRRQDVIALRELSEMEKDLGSALALRQMARELLIEPEIVDDPVQRGQVESVSRLALAGAR